MDNNSDIALDLALCQQDFDPHALLSSWEGGQSRRNPWTEILTLHQANDEAGQGAIGWMQ